MAKERSRSRRRKKRRTVTTAERSRRRGEEKVFRLSCQSYACICPAIEWCDL